MELRDLRYFIQIAKDRNYTLAAKHMYVSQPALSKMMKKLEQEFGIPLVENTSGGVLLTDYGQALYNKVVPLINEFDTLQQFVSEVRGARSGRLCVGVTPMMGTLHLANIAVDFCNQYPNVELKLEEGGSKVIRRQVTDGEIDIGFCISGDKSDRLEETVLFKDSIIACVHNSSLLSDRDCLSFKDLKNESFNIYSNAATLHTQIMERCISAGFQPKINITSSKVSMVIQFTRLGKGICILPRPYAERHHSSELKMIPLSDDFPWIGCMIKRRDAYQSYVSILFEQFVRRYFELTL